jgi:hypothetical protein
LVVITQIGKAKYLILITALLLSLLIFAITVVLSSFYLTEYTDFIWLYLNKPPPLSVRILPKGVPNER